MDAHRRAARSFERIFGAEPDGIAFAPGRVNLIGDHVDYNDGLVLPMPLSMGTAVAWRRTSTSNFTACAADFSAARYQFDPLEPPPVEDGWHSLVHGMASLLLSESDWSGGLELAIAGNLPRGAGLSSSASLCIAIGRAIVSAGFTANLSPRQLAVVAQDAEHRFAGVACGIMDQMVISAGEPGIAMLLDCRTLETSQVAIPEDWSVLIVQSGVVRELVEGEYNERRTQCESAARKMGVASLRDASLGQIDHSDLSPTEARRARHVILEIERTRHVADAIEISDLQSVGRLLREAHASMRDLFEASHPEVDRQVEDLNSIIGPAGGARMTGGGFGGAIVAIFEVFRSESILEELDLRRGNHDGREAGLIRALN